MDIEGNPVGKVTLRFGVTISDLAWNCERFNMEEQVDPHGGAPTLSSKSSQPCCRPDGKFYFAIKLPIRKNCDANFPLKQNLFLK